MNFDFSTEQEELRRQAAKFFETQGRCTAARAVLDGERDYDRESWAKAAEMGWLGAAIEEDFGGVGLGYLELCVLFEEVGRAMSPIPYASTIFAAEAIRKAGSAAQKEKYLPQIADGSVIACCAFFEPGQRDISGTVKTVCRDEKLTGEKAPVSDLALADIAIVSAEGENGLDLYVVDLKAQGVEREALEAMELVRPQGHLKLDGVAAERLGEAGQGADHLRHLLDLQAVLTAFEQIGSADAAMAMSLEYAKDRHAFGRPIGGNQAVKHKLADMFVKNQLARSHAFYGAWALASDAPELPRAAAGAHLAASEALDFAGQESVEIHGGIGFTWESDCQFFYRRARLLSQNLGAKSYWVDQLVAQLRGRNR